MKKLFLILLCCVCLGGGHSPFAFGAAGASISKSMTGDQLAEAGNKLSYYAQVLNDYMTMKFDAAIEDRIIATEKWHKDLKDNDPYNNSPQPFFRQQSSGFGSRFDRAMENNGKTELRLDPADKAMSGIAEIYPRLLGKMKTLDQYYQRQDYQDDKYVKSERLTKELEQDLVALRKSRDELDKAFDQLSAAYAQVALERFEKANGKKLFWLHGSLMLEAKKLLLAAPADMKDFKLEAFDAQFKKFKEITDQYEEYINTAGDKLRQEANGKIKPDWISEYINAARTIMGAKREDVPRRYANTVETLYTYYRNMAVNSNEITFSNPPDYPRWAVKLIYLTPPSKD